MTVGEVLNKAESLCENAGKSTHPARLLLMHLLQSESYELFAKLDEIMTPELVAEFFAEFSRYVEKNEPIQYIIGYEYFAGRNLFVDKGALIPRPETEELVYEIIFILDEYFSVEQGYKKINVADIGTGSGAIAVSVAKDVPTVEMIATDISIDALTVAKRNAAEYELDIKFMVGDMLDPLISAGIKLDVLLSNPPYIPATENVQAIVKDNEPNVALFGGDDGLFFYRKIIENAHKILNPNAYLIAFEIGFDQAERLVKLAKANFPNAKIWIKQDLQGRDRMLFIQKK